MTWPAWFIVAAIVLIFTACLLTWRQLEKYQKENRELLVKVSDKFPGLRRKETPMTPPTNTYTVVIADAHGHTVTYPTTPGGGGNTMAGKADAIRNVLQEAADNAATICAAFTQTDTLTITATQP